MMVSRGDSGINDFMRNDLEKNHPQIRIEDTPHFYDLSVFNRCAETGNVLLTIECWQEVHPGLISIPVNWEYSIPYGILYSLNCTGRCEKIYQRGKGFLLAFFVKKGVVSKNTRQLFFPHTNLPAAFAAGHIF